MRIKQSDRLFQNIKFNHRKILLCAHWNSHDHLSHSVLYKKSFTVQTMDKCWPSCDIYEFQLSFSPSVPIFCMVICWQIFIVILGPERPEEMHLKIHTGKVGRTIMKLQNSEFISAPTVWPCSDATVWGVKHYVFFHAARGPHGVKENIMLQGPSRCISSAIWPLCEPPGPPRGPLGCF